MRARPSRWVEGGFLATLILLCTWLSPLFAAETPQAAYAWLEKMIRAARSLNYDGTLVYRRGNQVETIRIIHRADSDRILQRIISLNDVRREVLSDGSSVTYVLPDKQAVLVIKDNHRTIDLLPTLAPTASKPNYYTLSVAGEGRVAGRAATILVLEPKDRYRYGYRLWVDRETGFLLQSELGWGAERPLELLMYTAIRFPGYISGELLNPETPELEYFTHYTSERVQRAPANEDDSEWRVTWLPEGFVMSDRSNDLIPPLPRPVEHLVFTDGVASLSVFIGHRESEDVVSRNLFQAGGLNAFSRDVDQYRVIVMGEVPALTVEAVGKSISRRGLRSSTLSKEAPAPGRALQE